MIDKDGKVRCRWANPKNDLYIAYHDEEWGQAVRRDDAYYFEMLLLESFQAGLSWECVLNKRENFRRAFDNFDYRKISKYDEKKIEELRQDAGIIRNGRKIRAAIQNAVVYQEIQDEFGSFSDYIWGFSKGRIIYENDKVNSEMSDRISKDLQKRGMKFVGTTIIYSFLQAVGIINSHEEGCFLWRCTGK